MSLMQSKCMPPPQTSALSFFEVNFFLILHFTMQIIAHQEGTKINTGVNKGPLKNIGTHWNIRHRLFQRVPISFSLYTDTSEHIRLFTFLFYTF